MDKTCVCIPYLYPVLSTNCHDWVTTYLFNKVIYLSVYLFMRPICIVIYKKIDVFMQAKVFNITHASCIRIFHHDRYEIPLINLKLLTLSVIFILTMLLQCIRCENWLKKNRIWICSILIGDKIVRFPGFVNRSIFFPPKRKAICARARARYCTILQYLVIRDMNN